jgi:hypothetical protein
MLWHTPIIPPLRRLRQEDDEFMAILCCIMRLYLKKYIGPSVVVIPVIPGLGGEDWKDQSSRPVQAESETLPNLKSKPGVVVCVCYQSQLCGRHS